MKWRFFFKKKKRGKKEKPEDIYSEIKSKKCSGDEYSAEFTFEAYSPQTKPKKPTLNTQNLLFEESENSYPTTPNSDTSAPAFPEMTDLGDSKFETSSCSMTLAFCPNCHTMVQPITKKRPNIRTNPWLPKSASDTFNQKRPRLSDITQPDPTNFSSMTDSGIFDPQSQSEISASTGEPGTAVWENMPQNKCPRKLSTVSFDESSKPSAFMDDFLDHDESDAENEPPRRLKRRKKKRRSSPQKDSCLPTPTPPFFFKDPGDNLWLDCGQDPPEVKSVHQEEDMSHNRVYYQPPDTLDLPYPGNIPSFSGADRVAEYLTYLDAPTVGSPYFQSEASTLVDHSNNKETLETFSDASDTGISDALVSSYNERSVDDIRESLRDKIESLCRNKLELEQKFSMVEQFQEKQSAEQENLAQEVLDYRKELLLRSLSSAQRQLDTQLDSLQANYDALVNFKMRKMFTDQGLEYRWQYPPTYSTNDNVLVQYEDT